MAHGSTWLVDEQLILVKVWGAWDDKQIRAFDTHATQVLDAVMRKAKVHTIFEASGLTLDTENTPAMTTLMSLRDMISGDHPKAGWNLIVGVQNAMFRFAFGLLTRAVGSRIRLFNTLPQALEFIQAMDTDLPDLSTLDVEAAMRRADVQEIGWPVPPHPTL